MATTEPRQKSLEPPYLWRFPTLWQMPQWAQANQWRWFVYNQPIAMLCRARLINYLLGLPWEVSARKPDEKDALQDDIAYYTDWVFKSFDLIFDKAWQDALDLPIGGNLEIIRWPAGVKPIIKVGEETYKVTRDHPAGHPDRLINIDGATLFPTYEPDIPLAQKIPESDAVVYFTIGDIGRLLIQPRTEMRLNGYGKAPPEQIYLAMTMVSSGDHYYSDLLKNIPPVGILDLMDMEEKSAKDWAGSIKELFTSDEAFKVPILYEHTSQASFIPFGKSPQELLFDTASLRYARIVAASYGLTLGNLGLEPKGETLAGSIRDDMQASQGYGFVIEKTKGLIDENILPPYLEWNVKLQDFEKLTGKGRAFLVVAQALKAAKEIGAIKPSEVQQQLVRDGFITVEVEAPNDEELAQQQLPFGGQKQLTDKVTDKKPAAEGGRGDIQAEKASLTPYELMDPVALVAINKAQVDLQRPLSLMTGPVDKALRGLTTKATDARLRKLARAVAKAALSLLTKADIDPGDLDALIDSEKWYLLPDSLATALQDAYIAAFSNGAMLAANQIAELIPDIGFTLDFNLTNPETLAQLEQKAALLVTRVNDGTKFYLKRMLVSGVEKGLASPEIAQMIKDGVDIETILKSEGFLDDIVKTVKAELEGMTPERVNSIVNTEVNRAESEGRLRQWSEMGLTKKRWVTDQKPCEICQGNAAKGFVEMSFVFDDVFSGTLTPPGHPSVCRCHIEFDEQELMGKAGELKVWTGD